jgi:cytochrome b561
LTLEFATVAVPTRLLLDLHRSVGTMVLSVALARIAWRATFAKFPAFPVWMSSTQKWIATKTEHILYALLLLQPLTGLTTTLLLGKPFHLLFWTVPALLPRNLDLWQSLLALHRVGAYCLFAVIGGHAGMALLHHWGFRDEVLERMAPWLGRNRPRLVVVNSEAAGIAET